MSPATHVVPSVIGQTGANRLLIFSAADQGGIQRVADGYHELADKLKPLPDVEEADYLNNLAHTLYNRRSLLNWRSFATVNSVHDLQNMATILSRPIKRLNLAKLAFVFTGQGAQYARMADSLLGFPPFVNSLRRSEMYFDGLGSPWALLEELFKSADSTRINEPGLSQPLCTALQIGIVDLLRHLGLSPSVVMGHSSGEKAAVYAAGALCHRSACKVAYLRGVCADELLKNQESPKHSGMMSIGLSEAQTTAYLDELKTEFGTTGVVVACVNSPSSVTASGSITQLDWLKALLDRKKVFARKLRVSVAYHSPEIQPVALKYEALLGRLESGHLGTSTIPMVSSVTGDLVCSEELQAARYWVSNMVKQVKFSDALTKAYRLHEPRLKTKASIRRAGFNDILEIGPHGALRGPILDTLRQSDATNVNYFETLNRSDPVERKVFDVVGALFSRGHVIDVSKVNDVVAKKRSSARVSLPYLPKYPFDHSRHYWLEVRSGKEGYRLRSHPRLDLLGTPSADWNPIEPRWTRIVRTTEQPWVLDHVIQYSILYPGSGMLVMALEAVKQVTPRNRQIVGYSIKDTVFSRPIVIPQEQGIKEVEIVLHPCRNTSPKTSATWNFKIYASEDNGERQEKCSGVLSARYDVPIDVVDNGKEARSRQSQQESRLKHSQVSCTKPVDSKKFYDVLGGKGLSYGPTFQVVSNIKSDSERSALADVTVYQWPSQEQSLRQDHIVHPITLDGIFQIPFAAGEHGFRPNAPAVLPSRVNNLWIRSEGVNHPSMDTVAVTVEMRSAQRKLVADILAFNPTDKSAILSVELEYSIIESAGSLDDPFEMEKTLCYEMQWKPDLDLMDHKSLELYCEAARCEPDLNPQFYENIDYLVAKYLFDAIDSVPQARLEKMPVSLQRYQAWAVDCRARFEGGSLSHVHPTSKTWSIVSENAEERARLMREMGASDLGHLFMEIASSLPAILAGKLDPVQFMFQDDKVERFYRATNQQVICYRPLARYLDLLTHKYPSLRVLEIGAGTGGSTYHFLDMLTPDGNLPRFSQYDYTDISRTFLEKAKEVFAKQASNMGFFTSDVERHPSDQGLAVGTYDVVFAASVLHATRNIESTLRNARSLLKPGGRLILIEIVEETVRMSFAFGLFPGWWLGEEENRVLRPWLRTPEWQRLLQRTGFSGVDLEIPDFTGNYHEYSLIITTATEKPIPPQSPAPITVITQAGCEKQASIARAIQPIMQDADHVCDIAHLRELSESTTYKDRHWINLCEIDQAFLSEMDESGFKTLRSLVQSAQTILWATGGGGRGEQDPRFHVVDGFARAACTENPRLSFTTLALQATTASPVEMAQKVARIFIARLRENIAEPEYLEQDGRICIQRVMPSETQDQVLARKQVLRYTKQAFNACPPLTLALGTPGLLDTLHFVRDDEYDKPLPAGLVEVKIHTGGVNFRDCLTALGQLEADFIGVEYAGVVSRVPSENGDYAVGDRVAAFCFGSYRTYARSPVSLLTPVPDNVSLTDAAASLLVFSTAWYSLVNIGRLSKGDSVLIHSAAGGTGQAAIQVARYLGAEIYVTVGSLEKKKFLQDTYGIADDRIFASRDLTFVDGILRETQGRGVDVILNSLSGESLLASWECIAAFGRFVELGVRDILGRSQLPMFPFRKGCSFNPIVMHQMIGGHHQEILMNVSRTVMRLLSEKAFFVPQPLRVFGISEVAKAFREFQGGSHYGRMVVEMKADDIIDVRMRPSIRYQFNPLKTYLITGGLGGLGRSALWMVERGARNIVLLSRSGMQSRAAQDVIQQLLAAGANVHTPRCDIGDKVALRQVLADCTDNLPPIAGCIHAAMVLKDTFYEKMSFEDWTTACVPKVQGSWNLHCLLPKGLDFFTCLSSLSCIIGNAGQANYAAGNAYMDGLARHRTACGEAATTINLGWVEEEGVVAESSRLKTAFAKVESMPPISMTELYALLDYACDPAKPLLPHQVITGLAPPRVSIADPVALEAQVPWLYKPSFRGLAHAATRGSRKTGADTETRVDYKELFRDASDTDSAEQVVSQCVKYRLSKALAVSEDDIDMSVPLHVIGVDSLFGIELRNYLAKQFDADVAVFDLMGAASAEAACAMVASRSTLRRV